MSYRVKALALFVGGGIGVGAAQADIDWETSRQQLPLNAGVGRVFKIGTQFVNCFVEPAWNVSADGPAPRYAITFGLSLLYPDFWGSLAR